MGETRGCSFLYLFNEMMESSKFREVFEGRQPWGSVYFWVPSHQFVESLTEVVVRFVWSLVVEVGANDTVFDARVTSGTCENG